MLRRRQLLPHARARGARTEEEVDDDAGPSLEIGRAIGGAGLDALEEQAVQKRQETAGDGVDIEIGGQFAGEHALAQEQLAGPGQALATGRQHLADARLAVGLRPGLDQRDLARVAVVVVDGLDIQGDGDGQAFRRGARRREPGVREMLAARRERLVGAGSLLIRQGVLAGELPAGLDVDAVTRGLLALLDGLLLQRIEAGSAYRPADVERRAAAIVELMLAAAARPGSPEPMPTA